MVDLSLKLMVNYIDKETLVFQVKMGCKEISNTKTCLLEQGAGLCCNDCSLSSFEKEGVYCESKGEFILNDPLNCKGALVNAIKKDIDKRGFKNVQT
jgi:hypothetical protein